MDSDMTSGKTDSHAPEAMEGPWAELRFSFFYVVFASLWIIGSDALLDQFEDDPVDSLPLQTFKGLNFVFTTGVLIYWVLHRSYERRRKAEAQVVEATQRFELVARTSTDAIFDWNLAAGTIWWSESLQSLFGYAVEPGGTRIEAWYDRIHAEDRERVTAGFTRILRSTGDVWADEFRFLRRDGSIAEVAARANVIRDAAGKAVRMVGGVSDVTSRRRAEEALRVSRKQMRALSAKLQSSREQERTRIAREIHDELGQMLTGLKMDLRWIERRLTQIEDQPPVNPILDKVVEATELADHTIACVQKISSELRPGVLDNLGLAAAIKHEATRFQERAGITCQVRLPEAQPTLAGETATGTFRILQEALTNVARHANATEVQIELRSEDAALLLEVSDNGKGIGEADLTNPRSLGLLGMKERAVMMGAELGFSRGPNGGTRVTLRLPKDAHDTSFWELP
jgi:two-component system, NarL family, sensor histidine kinase UhpB